MPDADEILSLNAHYAAELHNDQIDVHPQRKLAVVACMDSRINPLAVLGLGNGDAHMLRNAGGVITDDVIRSLCLSQRLLGTEEIVLVHHTDCGMQSVDEAAFLDQLNDELGAVPPWSIGAFSDPYEDVEKSMELIDASPFIRHKLGVRGFVFDVASGVLNEVAVKG